MITAKRARVVICDALESISSDAELRGRERPSSFTLDVVSDECEPTIRVRIWDDNDPQGAKPTYFRIRVEEEA